MMRRAPGIALVVAVLAAGAAATLALRTTGPAGASGLSDPSADAITYPGGMAAGPAPPVLGVGKGTTVRFTASAAFALKFAVSNRASDPVTITDARAVLSHGSVLRQLGTALTPQSPTTGCGQLSGAFHFNAGPTPLLVAPGKFACIQLSFRFLSCPLARDASRHTTRLVDIAYTPSGGTSIHESLSLGDAAELKIETPFPPCNPIPVSPSGAIGPLSVGSSTDRDIDGVFGPARIYTKRKYPGGARFAAVGYDCKRAVIGQTGIADCATVFYSHRQTGTLAVFYTRSRRFTYRGIHPRTSAKIAMQKLGEPTESGCYTGYRFSTKTGSLVLSMRRDGSRVGFMALIGPNDNLHVLGCIDQLNR